MLAAAAAGLAPAGVAPESSAFAPSKRCQPGRTHAVIGGRHVCLRAGQRCRPARDARYHSYGFHCHSGRLTRARREPPLPPSPPPPPPPAATVVATVPVPGEGDIAVGEAAVWAISSTVSPTPPHPVVKRVVKIDPATNTVAGSTPIGPAQGSPDRISAIAAGEGGVWVGGASESGSVVYRLDPATGAVTAAARIGPPPAHVFYVAPVAVGLGSVWVADPTSGSVVRIDPATSAVVATIPDLFPRSVAVGGGAAWATGRGGLLRIDPATNAATVAAEEGCGPDVVADAAFAWASCVNTLVRVDVRTGDVTTFRGMPALGSMAIALGSLWGLAFAGYTATGEAVTHVVQVDPQTGAIVGTTAVVSARDLEVGFGSVWLRIPDHVLRVAPAQ